MFKYLVNARRVGCEGRAGRAVVRQLLESGVRRRRRQPSGDARDGRRAGRFQLGRRVFRQGYARARRRRGQSRLGQPVGRRGRHETGVVHRKRRERRLAGERRERRSGGRYGRSVDLGGRDPRC